MKGGTLERRALATDQPGLANENWILLSTILASSMAFIDSSALNVALPAIQSSLQASGEQLLWIINGYLLMLAALILVGGSLGDRFGRKKVFMAGIGLFSLASLACGISPSVQWLIAARIIQGIGGALMIPGSLAIITSTLTPARRGRAIGIWSSVTTLVTVAGPVLGGFLSDLGLWRAVFLINLPLGILSLVILYFKVPETRDEELEGPVDVAGVLLVAIGLAALTYGFISAPDLGFADLRVYISLLVGVIALVAFVFVEARRQYPMMPLNLFRSRPFSGANLLTLFLYGALSVMSFFASLNLIQVQGYSKTAAGLTFLPFTLLLASLSGWAGSQVDRRGPRIFLILGPGLVGCGFLWMAYVGLTRGPVDYWTSFFPAIVFFGLGMGLTVAPLTTTVMSSLSATYSGTASGINNAVSRIAGVLAIAILGSTALFVFSSSLSSRTASLNLSSSARQQLSSQAHNLGGAAVPPGVDPQAAPQVERAIKLSFVDTFRIIMLVCTALAWLSAVMSAIFIEPGPPARGQTQK